MSTGFLRYVVFQDCAVAFVPQPSFVISSHLRALVGVNMASSQSER